MSPESGCIAIQGVCWSGRNSPSDTINPELLKYMGTGSRNIVWVGVVLDGHTDLHVLHGETLIGVRYRDDILYSYVRPHAGAIGNDFIHL